MLVNYNNGETKVVSDYEYEVETIPNTIKGKTDTEQMFEIIKKYAQDGWKLHTVYSNELGKNGLAIGGIGVNSTYSEDIMIFERQIKHNVQSFTEKTLSVINYAEDSSIRFGQVELKTSSYSDKMYISLYGNMNKDIKVDALQINMKLITIFDEEIELEKISFINVEKNAGEFKTEFYEFELDRNIVNIVRAVKVYLLKYVAEGKAIDISSIPYIDVSNDEEHLLRERQFWGHDYVGKFEDLGNEWKCICGKMNVSSNRKCVFCGRNKQGIAFDLSEVLYEIYGKAKEFESSREIHDYLVKYNKTFENDVIKKLENEIEQNASYERIYGNTKYDSLKILEQYINIHQN